MISVGAVVGGPECARFEAHVRDFAKHCRIHRESRAPAAKVNVVFHIPGSIADPGYTGPRTARFSLAEKTLMVQIGVEKQAVASVNDEELRRYIAAAAQKAIELAKPVFEKKGIDYELPEDRHVIEEWAKLEGTTN